MGGDTGLALNMNVTIYTIAFQNFETHTTPVPIRTSNHYHRPSQAAWPLVAQDFLASTQHPLLIPPENSWSRSHPHPPQYSVTKETG